jgi:hypothetical protein
MTKDMKTHRKAIVRLYDFKMLVRLAIEHIERTEKIKLDKNDSFFFLSGLDYSGDIFLRLSLPPLPDRPQSEQN